ncbi:mitochondrial ribosomal death-associated protein 3-domain-containing protein [Xylariomycetidae sp. FL0641]|nr:mitochondrial ribosomal death-associated protein 3-domain-containing protein [Xylariomycetidae sp. FL0641]
MASSNCWRCLARPSQRLLLAPGAATTASASPIAVTTSSATIAAFSTSAPAASKSGKPKLSQHVVKGKALNLARGKRDLQKKAGSKTKAPLPGERKAFRKRIQLSNVNALEVSGLDVLSPENLTDPASIGKVIGIPEDVIDQLRAVEAFKPTQNWGLFRSPHMLIRNETVDLAKQITDALRNKETLRMIVTGSKGSGKSIIGLQAMATGFLNKCVVINIPEAQELVIAQTEYSRIGDTELYSQPTYLQKLVQAILQSSPMLANLKIAKDYIDLPFNLSRNMSLADLLNVTKDPEYMWDVFSTFWKELLLPGRPPVLLTLDGLAHIMRISKYRSPAFELIHSHDLALIRLFVDVLSGKTRLTNGGAVLGITSLGNAPIIKSFDKALEQASAAHRGEPVPPRDPFYAKYDERVLNVVHSGVRVLDVHGVDKREARAIMEYWAASGILRARVDEANVSEKWTMAGHGVLAEMERVALYDIRVPM